MPPCDAAIGEVLAAAMDDTTVVVFSLNGMVANTSHDFLLPEMLRRVLENDVTDRSDAPSPAPGRAEQIRQAIPLEWRSAVKERLPVRAQDLLSRRWRRAERSDWSAVRAFRLIGSDMEGQVQINLRGREREGIVSPRTRVRVAVRQDRGRPLLVRRCGQRGPDRRGGAASRHALARGDRASHAARPPGALGGSAAVRPAGYALAAIWRISLNPHREVPPDGRSGHHQPVGWAIAAGPGIRAGEVVEERPLHDLTATIYARFGLSMPAPMRGRPIAAVLGKGGE